MLVRIANRKTLIRLPLKKQCDLGLHFLSMFFGRQLVLEILEDLSLSIFAWSLRGIICIARIWKFLSLDPIKKDTFYHQGPISSIKFVRYILNCAYVVF